MTPSTNCLFDAAGGGMVPVSSIYSGPMGSPAMASMPTIPSHAGQHPGASSHMSTSGHFASMGASLPSRLRFQLCGTEAIDCLNITSWPLPAS